MRAKLDDQSLITFRVSHALKSALQAEAWEEQRSLSRYIALLLERRGKWARTVGTAGGYDLAADVAGRPKDVEEDV